MCHHARVVHMPASLARMPCFPSPAAWAGFRMFIPCLPCIARNPCPACGCRYVGWFVYKHPGNKVIVRERGDLIIRPSHIELSVARWACDERRTTYESPNRASMALHSGASGGRSECCLPLWNVLAELQRFPTIGISSQQHVYRPASYRCRPPQDRATSQGAPLPYARPTGFPFPAACCTTCWAPTCALYWRCCAARHVASTLRAACAPCCTSAGGAAAALVAHYDPD